MRPGIRIPSSTTSGQGPQPTTTHSGQQHPLQTQLDTSLRQRRQQVIANVALCTPLLDKFNIPQHEQIGFYQLADQQALLLSLADLHPAYQHLSDAEIINQVYWNGDCMGQGVGKQIDRTQIAEIGDHDISFRLANNPGIVLGHYHYEVVKDNFYATFNLPQREKIKLNEVAFQQPIILDLYYVGQQTPHPSQVVHSVYHNGTLLYHATGNQLDRRRFGHSEGEYHIDFGLAAEPHVRIASYNYTVEPALLTTQTTAPELADLYIGSHWTSNKFDATFLAGDPSSDIGQKSEYGEGVYTTTDRKLGITAALNTLVEHGGTGLTEWKVYRQPGINLTSSSYKNFDDLIFDEEASQDLWRRSHNPAARGLIIYNDLIDKSAFQEVKVNPRAYRKVSYVKGQQLSVAMYRQSFLEILSTMPIYQHNIDGFQQKANALGL